MSGELDAAGMATELRAIADGVAIMTHLSNDMVDMQKMRMDVCALLSHKDTTPEQVKQAQELLQKIAVIEDYIAAVHFIYNEGGANSMVQNLTIEQYRARREEFLAAAAQ